MIPKNEARVQIREKLKNLNNKESLDKILVYNLSKILKSKKKIATYFPLPNEPNLENLKLFLTDSEFFFPKILKNSDHKLIFEKGENFTIGMFNIPEPNSKISISPLELDAIIVPGLCFSENGSRLGRGKGYYDKALADLNKEKLIGVTYSFVFPFAFSEESHDIKMGSIITELESFFLLDVL
ncbi:MAG: 5-formyltetrahydrofolate cyclo-ligase [Spirochaetia bacterium]|nr:5-formyltetrahydrofolate cyclo-ligase [Spirochaetia bacterium]